MIQLLTFMEVAHLPLGACVRLHMKTNIDIK